MNPPPTDISNTAQAEAFERVLDHDRAYFERNPESKKYVRLPLPGEFDAFPEALEQVKEGYRVRVTMLRWVDIGNGEKAPYRTRELVPPPSSVRGRA